MSEAAQDCVLVVDGDVIIRSVISDYLRDCGYRVLEAHAGQDALKLLRGAPFRVDVLLCDAELPGAMSGFELAQAVRREWRELQVLLAGRQDRKAEKAAELCDDGPEMVRPYHPQAVLDRIRRLRAG